MGNVVSYCEFSGSTLRAASLTALTAARQLAEHSGGQVIALLIGKGADAAAADAKKYAPKTVVVSDDRLEHYMAESFAPIVAKVAKDEGASAVLAVSNNLGKDLMPRVAGILDAALASDISSVKGKDEFVRPILAGNALATVKLHTDTVVVTSRQTEFDAAAPLSSEGEVTTAEAGEINTLGAEFLGVEVSQSERPDLSEASVVVSGGRGMKNGENFKHLEELCDVLGAALGASRAATDAGYVPADLQVGQTGKVVAPDLYFAVAISGAIQHLAGMKGSKVIVAINKDAEAPIFEVADYGLVTTWEKALPELIEALKAHKAAS